MDSFFIMLALLVLAGPVIAIVAVIQNSGLRNRIDMLAARLDAAERMLRRMTESEAPSRPPPLPERGAEEPPPPEAAPEAKAAPEAEAAPEPEEAETEPPEAEAPPIAARVTDETATGEVPPAAPAEPPELAPAEPLRSRAETVEHALTARWMVWLGALAVGLSAVFLFSYAIEQGWLGPLPRVVLGLALGAALIAGGEWTFRHPIPGLARAVSPDYVPPALTAAGLFALYASVYAAHGLFGLIGREMAFAGLGAVGFAGLVLALRQGWFVALLGLAGGYAMPALLESQSPAPVPVFLYVFALTTGCLAVMVFRKWPFLSVATIAGSLGWPLIWFFEVWSIADQGVLSLYAVATAASFALLSVGFPVKRPDTPATAWLGAMIADTSGMGFVAMGAVLVILAQLSNFNEAAFVFLGLYAGMAMVLGIRRAAFESLGVAGAGVMAVAFLLWPEPGALTIPPELARHNIQNWGDTFGPIAMPAEFLIFARAALGFSALYGIGGLLALGRAATPAVWAALSAGVPLFLFTVVYWRIGGFSLSIDWGLLAAALAALQLGAASVVHRFTGMEKRDEPLALYAAGCTAALALAFTCVLRDAWLTVALSAELLALALIWTRLPVQHLRTIAYLVAGVVLVRLVMNPAILDYHRGGGNLFTWVIYGYGLPAAAFLLASRRFGDARTDPLAAFCEAGGLAFALLTVTLQLRAWTAGTLWQPPYDLFDQAVQTAWWLVVAAVLMRREIGERSKSAFYGGRILLGLAALQVGLGALLSENPLFVAHAVGTLPLVNLLGLAYLVPAVLFWWIAADRRIDLPDQVRSALLGGAGVLVFVYLSLEVRHAFWGDVISQSWERRASDAEVYAYSAVWIAYALALLALGIRRDAPVVRYASLTVLGVAVAKVFLYDMADLTGLYRVASFLGLGLVLIGAGYVYRRFVFRPAVEEEPGAET
ncbi:MAG TPA: DUF2339 domain-containing protein [Thermohalobaculum sp.]|nr:DUF2339 domain-containing protein [Thermohalobaculum sp.]